MNPPKVAKSSSRGTAVAPKSPEDKQREPPKLLNFSKPDEREAHLRAFQAWLPQPLQNAPSIEWERLPSRVMGYLIRSVADSPDAISIALATGCALDALKRESLYNYCQDLTRLLRQLRTKYGVTDLVQLRKRETWEQYVADRSLLAGEVGWLVAYDALTSMHERLYLESLNERQRLVWEPYLLPPLPFGFMARHGFVKAITAAAQERRKEQSDVLVPLFPLLVEIAQLRKQAAERLTKAFCTYRDQVLVGKIKLPYHFQYTDRLFVVAEDAATLAEVKLREQTIALSLTLWDRPSWAEAHPERYGRGARYNRKAQIRGYAPESNRYFLQYEGPQKDLLWFGDLIANHLIGRSKAAAHQGFYASRPGLLTPKKQDQSWLFRARRPGEMIFDPESLYRGVLYGAALATLALTNGSRVNELLQVSATRFETIVVDELKNQQPTGRKIGILVQNLLPKGYTRESDRQFFLISEMAGHLLMEIGHMLEAAHGGLIPVVHPHKSTKEEDLSPEPYLFQWNAGADGRIGLLRRDDVGTLLRFLYHGLSLTTRTGRPIQIATHLLRHVLATHARTIKKVPAEAVAYLLHHRVMLPHSTRALTVSEATAYYSRLPTEQLLALLFEAQSTLTSQRDNSYLQAPLLSTLEEKEAALRAIFEQWGLIGPTAFGYCGAGLCIRPDNRALCLGCPYLVPHYSNLSKVKTWRKFYVLQVELHEAHGHHIDAIQSRKMIQHLDDLIAMMQIQFQTRQDGGFVPLADTLPPPEDEEGTAS